MNRKMKAVLGELKIGFQYEITDSDRAASIMRLEHFDLPDGGAETPRDKKRGDAHRNFRLLET